MTARRPSAYVSVFELFSVGVGPSSSHTVGPMRAARSFTDRVADAGLLARVAGVRCRLFGSLASTGVGHGTPDAVVAGLRGSSPETVDPDAVRDAWQHWPEGTELALAGRHPVAFARKDITLEPGTRLPGHPNAMTFVALDGSGAALATETYYSIGGGFIRREGEREEAATSPADPFEFASASALLEHCTRHGLSIAEIARANEEARRPRGAVDAGLDELWRTMNECIDAGLSARGVLPGPLGVARRAAAMHGELTSGASAAALPGEWLGTFALAVNEENASGGRVVTAPTNGAAGVLPAVARYWADLVCADADPRDGLRTFLLTATALGSLIKANASISGAEGGCQAEVGSACAMAAGGLTAVMGGSPAQVENAAEIAMEHHLGLTCDPVGGLVQIPCIERNAVAASTAATAAQLALRGDGTHRVSLDTVIETMRQTGADMSAKYKETSQGGLVVNVVEC
ncbi:L-serine ammonia-lyase [Myceligenerans indicum]|uniref:L-serine dehydratase n=1 Tax=Myceligenerans indicum TaxID=2593663 RepID=A0ABS1LG36_9MICO|nr:L-serine ammonia-lyase [Myceligenerans indicum]MBL0885190.1 L-serine ammonia-lyase [Myceligenerans indicum]